MYKRQLLSNVIFFSFKAIAAGNAAAAGMRITDADSGQPPQKLKAGQAVALSPQMTGGMIDDSHIRLVLQGFARRRVQISGIGASQQKILRIVQAACAILYIQIRKVFGQVHTEHEGATGAARNHRQALITPLRQSTQVVLGIASGVLPKTVGNHRQAAAYDILRHYNLVARPVHGPDHVQPGLRIIHIHITARIKNHITPGFRLFHPARQCAKITACKSGQGSARCV